MAELYNHIFMLGPNGLADEQFVNNKIRLGKNLLTKRLIFNDNRKSIEIQKTPEAAVREATTYANFAHSQEAYINKAKEAGATAYYVALADWFSAPKVLEIDVDGWTGKTGQTIRVKAKDNVMVARVSVVIRDQDENVLEMGEAVQSEAGSAWWNYTTKSVVRMMPFPIVEAIAEDLPGNRDSFAIS